MYIIMKIHHDVKKNFSFLSTSHILYLTNMVKFIIIYKMKKQMWKSREVEVLRKHYNEVSMEQLLEMLPGRTENSIYKKVQYLRKKGFIIKRTRNGN